METIENPSGIVVFDTETTGLDRKNDEILQFSACDGQGKTLINTYLRPVRHTEWPEAMAVNGITPAMVADAPTLDEMADRIRAVLGSARTLIGYNTPFDLGFVSGIWKPGKDVKIVDVMLDFANNVYREWDSYHHDFRWQKLVTAAKYYGYEFKAHDSMQDVFATLYVHQKMEEEREKRFSVYEAALAANKENKANVAVVVLRDNRSHLESYWVLTGDKWYHCMASRQLTDDGLKKAISLWVSQGCQHGPDSKVIDLEEDDCDSTCKNFFYPSFSQPVFGCSYIYGEFKCCKSFDESLLDDVNRFDDVSFFEFELADVGSSHL